VDQLEQNMAALKNLHFDEAELAEIDRYAQDGGVNLWAPSSEA
jgi:L-glyceraldehyde 3-phosphate reductase